LSRPIPCEPSGDKVIRMAAQSAKIETKQVYLPKDAPWFGEFRAETLQFSRGKHDDQVDSVSQFLNWAAGRRGFRVVCETFEL
jgi:predicted phage terminase large subunit-like protein